MPTFKSISLLTLCFLSGSLYAQSTPEDQSIWGLKLGAGVIADSQPWSGIDTQYSIQPYFELNIGNWYFNPENPITYKADVSDWLSIYVGIGLRSDNYESPDFEINKVPESATFRGYDKPDTETIINYGASLGWLAINASTDISSHSKSDILDLTLEIPVYEGSTGFGVSTSVSAMWVDSNYVNYYYGISDSQVDNSVGRTKHQPDSATNYKFGIQGIYPVNDKWTLLAELSHTLLDDEISDSPLIDSSHQNSFGLLAVYQY